MKYLKIVEAAKIWEAARNHALDMCNSGNAKNIGAFEKHIHDSVVALGNAEFELREAVRALDRSG
jgi:hypothetical protein